MPPAILVIGEVAKLGNQISWFNDKPLFGRRIMVTRPADQAQGMYDTLRDLGAEVLPFPTIATEAYHDSGTWEVFSGHCRNSSSDTNWLIFTSENGVRYFMRRLADRGLDIRLLSNFKIAAIGFGTAKSLTDFESFTFSSFNFSADLSSTTTPAITR